MNTTHPNADTPPPSDSRSDLDATRALLNSILEGTHDAVVVIDLDRKIVCHNSKFLQMFRFTAEELERGGSNAIANAIAEQVEDPGQLLTNSGQLWSASSIELVDVLRFKDGRVYHRHVVPHHVKGLLVGRVASYRDITQRVHAQEALEQHRAFLEKAQEVAHVGSWVAELDGSDRLAWSRETYRIFGLDPTSAPTSTDFFALVHPDDREFVRRASDEALTAFRPYDVEHRIVRQDGSTRWIHERADIVFDEAGKPLRMVGTCQDITERRQLEERLRQSQKLEAIGRLAGGIAHDLNNALTAIAGYTELALGALRDEDPVKADIAEVRRAAERAESVTRQLLAFSRKQLLEPRVFSLGSVLTGLGRLLERLLGADIVVRSQVEEQVPPVYGDPAQIEQAVINLAVNARDAMPGGGTLTLSLTVVDADEAFAHSHQPMTPGRYVELAVSDTGQGMSADTQAHAFEPFFTTKDIGKGTGLGLAMVYGTVHQSGGHIFLDSELGRGTTFRLYFPDGSRHAKTDAIVSESPTAQRSILVVEDEPSVRSLVVSALEHDGYRVLPAASGEEALEVARAEGAIDLLLTDARMPGMSGAELANTLLRTRPRLPVVVMSGYTDDALRFEGTAQAIPLLPKPFTPKELRKKIAEMLARPA